MKIAEDMKIGCIHNHEKYGDMEIIDYRSAAKVIVRFKNTGYETSTKATHIRDGLVRDRLYVPESLKVGSVHSTGDGDVVVTEYESANKIKVKFIETGCERLVRSDYIRSGSIKDYLKPKTYGVGYLGSEKVTGTKFNKLAHKRWSHMLERCYSNRWHNKKPTYEDCEVCDEWKNFTVFLKWFKDNYPKDGGNYHLDKDIKVEGNKIYSPEFCTFVSPEVNSMQRNGTLKSYFVLSHERHGIRYVRNLSRFAKEFDAKPNGFSYLINGHYKTYFGWSLIRRYDTPYFFEETA